MISGLVLACTLNMSTTSWFSPRIFNFTVASSQPVALEESEIIEDDAELA